MRKAALALSLLLLTGCAQFTAAACGGPNDPGADEHVVVPDEIAGLKVERDKEATATLNKDSDPKDTYQCPGGGRVYSMRDVKPRAERGDPKEEGELRAVLQISRLAPDARLDDIEFLRGLLKGPTGNINEPTEINCIDVYVATAAGNEQLVTMWFNDRYMFFLTVREDATVPGQVVGIDFRSVIAESVKLGPPGYVAPDPASCPEPSLAPTTAPTSLPPTTVPTSLPPTTVPSDGTTVPTETATPVTSPTS